MEFSTRDFVWTREPERYTVTEDTVEIVTKPHTDRQWAAHDGQAPDGEWE